MDTPTNATVTVHNPTCKSCRHWANANEPDKIGECHRHAPVIDVAIADRYFLCSTSDDGSEAPDWIARLAQRGWWPITNEDDLCGEYMEILDPIARLT